VRALAAVASYLPEDQKGSVLDEALLLVQTTLDKQGCVYVLTELTPRQLSVLYSSFLYPLWQQLLQLRAAGIRRDLLSDLSRLSPVLGVLGAADVYSETASAITAVERWWPHAIRIIRN
jgi:hypothetical protein